MPLALWKRLNASYSFSSWFSWKNKKEKRPNRQKKSLPFKFKVKIFFHPISILPSLFSWSLMAELYFHFFAFSYFSILNLSYRTSEVTKANMRQRGDGDQRHSVHRESHLRDISVIFIPSVPTFVPFAKNKNCKIHYFDPLMSQQHQQPDKRVESFES